jgi:hypothetical protein
MVVERMNELSVMVELIALLCVLAVQCTTWMNFVYSSCHRGERVAPQWFHIFLHDLRRLKRGNAPSRSSMMAPSMIVSSW